MMCIGELLYLLIQLSDTVYMMSSTSRYSPVYCASVLTAIAVAVIAVALLWTGINRRRPVMLVPHLIVQV